MVASSSNYIRLSAPADHPVGARTAALATGSLGAVRQLVDRADALYLRAPELALVLGERAAALAEAAGSDELWIRAESLVVSAKVRIGDRPATVGRAPGRAVRQPARARSGWWRPQTSFATAFR